MAGLIYTIPVIVYLHISHAGLLRDVDADCIGCTRGFQNLTGSGTICIVSKSAGHFGRNFQKFQERVPEEILQYCRIVLGLAELEERNFLNFPWSNSMTRDSTIFSRSWMLACAMAFSSVENEFPSGVAIFCLVRKIKRSKISLSG